MYDKFSCTIENALIVGGSNGIGAAIGQELLKRGVKKLYIADIETPLIENPKIEFIKTDLRYDNLDKLVLDVDSLIITAGVGRLAFFEDLQEADIEKYFKINTISAIKLIKKYYELLSSNKDFYVAVVSSITGIIASPLYSLYSSTKAALHKFIEGINAELSYKKSPNRILEIAPGHIEGTKFHGQQTELELLQSLAKYILSSTFNRQTLLIPKYEEVYKDVIDRYIKAPHEFALSSLEYKLSKGSAKSNKLSSIGYLSGTFDLFHIGHLNLLKRAKEHCDYLVVGVHADTSHKGGNEIFIPLDERIEILKSVRYVDEVIVCPSEDIDAYKSVNYDYLFVGSDYKNTERFLRYEKFFKNTNTKIIYFPYTNTTSSTQIRKVMDTTIKKLRRKE